MKPRNTALLLVVAALLGAFVWWYEVKGGEERKLAEDAAKRLFPGLEGSAVEWIEIRTSDPEPLDARVERREGGWRVVKPLEAEADPVTLDGMATTLAEITSEATIETQEDPGIYGLGEGARVVRFRAGGAEHVLRLGKQAPVGPNTYASAGDTAAILTVPTYRATSLDKKLSELREHRLLRFDRSAIQGADVSWPGGAVTLEKKGDVWALASPLQGPADEATVDKLLSDAGFLRAEGFVDAPASDAELGLDAPELTLSLRAAPPAGGGEAPRFALVIGKPLAKDPTQRAVRVAGGPTYTVGVERLADFPRRVAAYRFKEIARFNATDARRIELRFEDPAGGAPLVESISQGDAGWSVESPPPGRSLVSGKPTRLVAELSRLGGIDVVSDDGGDAERRANGLAPPAVVIRVFGAKTAQDEPLLATVEIGHHDAQGFVATAGPGATLYRVDPALAEHVPTSLAAWRARFLSSAAEEPAPDVTPSEDAIAPDAPSDDPDPEGKGESVLPPDAGGPGRPKP